MGRDQKQAFKRKWLSNLMASSTPTLTHEEKEEHQDKDGHFGEYYTLGGLVRELEAHVRPILGPGTMHNGARVSQSHLMAGHGGL